MAAVPFTSDARNGHSGYWTGATDVAVTASLTDILEAVIADDVAGQVIALQVANTGANSFTDFRILLKDHADGEFYDYLLAADFIITTNSNMLYASSDPSVLASGAKVHIHFRSNGAYAFKVQAKRTTATTATALARARAA